MGIEVEPVVQEGTESVREVWRCQRFDTFSGKLTEVLEIFQEELQVKADRVAFATEEGLDASAYPQSSPKKQT